MEGARCAPKPKLPPAFGARGVTVAHFLQQRLGLQRSKPGVCAVLHWHVGKARSASCLTSDHLFPLNIDFHFKNPINSQPKIERAESKCSPRKP